MSELARCGGTPPSNMYKACASYIIAAAPVSGGRGRLNADRSRAHRAVSARMRRETCPCGDVMTDWAELRLLLRNWYVWRPCW